MTLPLFFGDPARQLFGVYHPAAEGNAAERAVVLCAPSPQEYMPTHWAYRRLAALLAKAGVHVLRFDYFGMGDSAGASIAIFACFFLIRQSSILRRLFKNAHF